MKTMLNTLLLFVVLLLVGAPSALGGTFPSSPWFGTNVQNQPDAASARNALGVPTGAHATNADNAGYATNAGHAVVADALAGGINATQVTGLGALAGSNRLAWSSLDNVPGFGTAALVGTNQFVNTNAWYQFTNNALPWASYYLASNPAGYQTAAQVASSAFNSTNGLPIAVWTLGTASQSNAASFDLAGKAVAVTNGYPWGNLYDATGKAQQATNGLPAGIWTLGNAAAADTNSMKVAASTNADYAVASGYATNAGGLIDSQNNGRVVISDMTTRIRDANGHSLFVATLGSPTSIRGPTNNMSQISVDDFGAAISVMEGNPIFSGTPLFTNANVYGTFTFTNPISGSGGSILADANDKSVSVLDANGVQRINISPNGDPDGSGGFWLNDTNGNNWIQSLTGHGGVAFGDGKGGTASVIDTNGNFSGHSGSASNLLGNLPASQVTGLGNGSLLNTNTGSVFHATNADSAATAGTATNLVGTILSSQVTGLGNLAASNRISYSLIDNAPSQWPLSSVTNIGSVAGLSSNTVLIEAGALIAGSNYYTSSTAIPGTQVTGLGNGSLLNTNTGSVFHATNADYATTAGNLTAVNTNNINTNNASQLTSGTIPDARISSTVSLNSPTLTGILTLAGYWINLDNGSVRLSATHFYTNFCVADINGTVFAQFAPYRTLLSGTVTASGSVITNGTIGNTTDLFQASNSNGVVARIDSSGQFTGNGAGLTNLTATNLVGTVPAANLPTSIVNGTNLLSIGTNQIGLSTMAVTNYGGGYPPGFYFSQWGVGGVGWDVSHPFISSSGGDLKVYVDSYNSWTFKYGNTAGVYLNTASANITLGANSVAGNITLNPASGGAATITASSAGTVQIKTNVCLPYGGIGYGSTTAPTSNSFVAIFGAISGNTTTNWITQPIPGAFMLYWTTNGATINSKQIGP